jgi:uncharacterized protein (TIGR03435 family)
MKRLIYKTIALAAFSGTAIFAQSLPGSWQGTLKTPGKDLRVVFKISTTDKDAMKAVLYSIDQAPQGLPASEVARQGSTVKILVPGVGGRFEGKLSADGTSIAGDWTQGPTPIPLTLTRATPATAWAIPDAPPPPKKMRADADPMFEVATVKPTQPDSPGQSLTVQGNRMVTRGTTLSFLMAFAWGVHPKQISGGPAWLESDRWDITGQPNEDGQPSDKQLRTMLQKLLTERFKLTFHREKKDLSAYVVTVGKTGSKLAASEGDPNGLPGLGFRKLGGLFVRNARIDDFTGLMQTMVLDRPVVDQTGLSGRYDFTLDWTPDASQFGGRAGQGPPPADDAPPDLFTAIQQQLGLKMESTKAAVDVLAIDHVEKPSDN